MAGSTTRELLRLAGPMAAVQAGNQLMNIVDTAVVGRLGAEPLGAIGLANGLFFGVQVLGIGTMFGLDPLASQAVGGGNLAAARKLAWQAAWLALLASLVLTAVTAATPLLLPLFGIQQRVSHLAALYLWIRCLGILPLLLYMGLRSYLAALGRTRPMVVAMLLANVLNLFLDVLLVFGGQGWPGPLRHVPALGVAGSAIATVTSVFLQAGLLILAVRLLPAQGFERSGRRFDRAEVLHAARIGVPAGLQMMAEVGVFALAGLLAGSMGPEPLAAHQIALTLASLTFTGATGVASAGSVMVGRAVGAGDTAGARRAGLSAFSLGWVYMGLCALTFLLIPGILARALTDQADVIAAATPLLLVAGVFQLSDGTQVVGAGVLRGAGDTRTSFLVNLAGHWALGLPVAIALGFGAGLGVTGLWWGLCAGLTAVAVALYFRFRSLSSRPIRPVVRGQAAS